MVVLLEAKREGLQKEIWILPSGPYSGPNRAHMGPPIIGCSVQFLVINLVKSGKLRNFSGIENSRIMKIVFLGEQVDADLTAKAREKMGEGAKTKSEVGYVPRPDFQEDNKESLIDIQMNENTELWLIQLPYDQFPDLDGQKVSLELDGDGPLGAVEGKPGKAYDLVNYPSVAADITVFLSSPSRRKVAGKIS